MLDIYLMLNDNFLQTEALRDNSLERRAFFVSYVKPDSAVAAKTLSRWVVTLLEAAGVDTSQYKAHATRSAAGALLSKSLNSVQICKLADWSATSGVYQKFYERYV